MRGLGCLLRRKQNAFSSEPCKTILMSKLFPAERQATVALSDFPCGLWLSCDLAAVQNPFSQRYIYEGGILES